MPTRLRLRLAAFGALIVAVVVLASVIDLPSVDRLRHEFGGTGLLGGLAFALLYAALTLVPIPATVYTIAAGAVFGAARGFAIAWVGATLGAVLAFGIGRLLGRDAVGHLIGPRLGSLDGFLDRRGFTTVLIARFIPVVPYTAFNYLSGLTRLRIRQYAPATALGIVPSVAVYSSLGGYGNNPGSWPFITAVAALVILTTIGLAAARRRRIRGSGVGGDEPGPGIGGGEPEPGEPSGPQHPPST